MRLITILLKISNNVKISEYKILSKIIWDESVFKNILNYKFHKDPNTYYLYYNKELIGFIEYGTSSEFFREFGIKFVGIHPKYRGKKFGDMLINKVISEHKGLVKYIYATVPKNTFLVKHYERLGFKKYARIYYLECENGLCGFFNSAQKQMLKKETKILKCEDWLILRI